MSGIPGYDQWKLATPPEYEITEQEERALDYEHAVEALHNKHAIEPMESAPRDGSEIAIYLTDNQECRLDRRVVFFAHGRWWDTNGGGERSWYWQGWKDEEIDGWLPLNRGRICGERPPPPPPELKGAAFDDEVPF